MSHIIEVIEFIKLIFLQKTAQIYADGIEINSISEKKIHSP